MSPKHLALLTGVLNIVRIGAMVATRPVDKALVEAELGKQVGPTLLVGPARLDWGRRRQVQAATRGHKQE